MDTVDCWRTDGTAIRSIERNSLPSNQAKWLLYRRIRLKKIKSENTPEIPCAMRVARAAPNTPRPSPATIQRSINIFKTEENIKRPNGIFDSPMELNIVERILYINRKGNPTK